MAAHDWLDKSAAPLIRFTGGVHELTLPVMAQDVGRPVAFLQLVLSTGNDDLRGGGSPGDNCDIFIDLSSGRVIRLLNVNQGRTWPGWSINTVDVPLPAGGIRGGDIVRVRVRTGFGGGIAGDNWNLNRIELRAAVN